MLRHARKVCGTKGIPVSNPDYGSEIGTAVWKAARHWRPGRGRSPVSLAALYAIRRCRKLRDLLERRNARLEEMEEEPRQHWQPVPTPIPLNDFEIISFVAAHGLKRSGKLLAMPPSLLRERLDEIQHRVALDRVDD